MTRVLVVGLDGADWDVIMPWVQAGKLPHLAQLLPKGCHAPLASTNPPITFPAWTSFMTGVNPGRHGVYDFCERLPGEFRVRFYNATDIQKAPFHRLLTQENKSIAVLGVPVTYPPEPLNGVMIPGFDAPGLGSGKATPDSFYPKSLYREIEQRFGGFLVGPNLVAFGPHRLAEATVSLKKAMANKGEVALYLLKSRPWDTFVVVLGETDTVCHYFWRFHDSLSPLHEASPPEFQEAILNIYRQADEILGKFLEVVPKDCNLILVSDHGMGGCSDKVIHLNLWLAREGFLTFKARGSAGGRLLQHRLVQKVLNLARDMGVRHIPHRLKKLIFYRTDLISRLEANIRYGAIDWEKTLTYSEEGFQYPSIRLNVKGIDPQGQVEPGAEYEDLCQRLAEKLLNWTDPFSGARMVKQVLRREMVYSGPLTHKAPDLLIEWNQDGNHQYMSRPSGMAKNGLPVERLDLTQEQERLFIWNRSAKHRPDGIFLGHGPAFLAGGQASQLRIMDLAPLILYLSGSTIPSDLDGRLPTEILAPDYVRRHPPRYAASVDTGEKREEQPYSSSEAHEIEEKLRSLGYLD
jgi:predicted AlkP superfamily phosphohydrolase/phosphomutase